MGIKWSVSIALTIALTGTALILVWILSKKAKVRKMSDDSTVEIARMTIPRDDWETIEDKERAFILGIGHISNEIMALRKLVVWTSYKRDPNTPESIGCHMQMRMVQRLLAGKLFEAHIF